MRYADKYGFYELNPFPGSNQIVVSNHALIYEEYRGKGFGQKQHEQRLGRARSLGYDAIVCTVNLINSAELHILKKNGWVAGMVFKSSETGHSVQVWSKCLN